MAKISETELQRRLKALEKSKGSSPKILVSNTDPAGTGYADGSEHYNSTTGNLFIFSGLAWNLSSNKLHIRYATAVTNLSSAGIAPSQGDVIGFSELPYTSGGVQRDYRGLFFGGATASTDPTDYEWTLTAGESGAVPTYERHYSTTAGLSEEMGNPTTPGSGVTWVVTLNSAPSTAYWVAERFTISGIVSAWQIYPVQAKDGGLPFVNYTKAGFNMPVLGDSTWIADAVIAVSSFTGRTYTNQKEFGYGTVVVITYDNGKLYGTYKRSGVSDTWLPPTSFIDGDLIVDGTVAADHLQANSVGADKIQAGAITVDKVQAAAITSEKITMDGPIEFNSTSSGLHWNKDAYGDGLYGGFIGRHVTAGGLDAIGLDFTSSTSSIRMSSGGRLITKGILLETGIPGTSVEYEAVGTHTFAITSGVGSFVSVVATGGGGGGANNWVASFHPGNPGGGTGAATTIAFLDSGGNVIGSVITAAGGSGAGSTVSANNRNHYGVQGGSSLHAQGGSGGYYGTTGGNGVRGSGGGGAGGSYYSGNAASLSPSGAGVSVADSLEVPVGAVSIRVIIGSGGSGGPSDFPAGNIAAGGNGGAGYASVTPPSAGSQLFDFEDLATNSVPWPTLGQMTTTSLGSLTNLGSGGAGWYYIAIINGNNGSGSAANFVGMPHYYSGTPTAGGKSAIWYKMK